MDISFNELSLEHMSQNYNYDSQQIINTFVKTLLLLFKQREDFSIHAHTSFFSSKKILDWLNDSNNDIEHRRLLLRIRTGYCYPIIDEVYSTAEFNVQGQTTNALGCLVAYLTEIPTISMETQDAWKNDKIIGVFKEINYETGDLTQAADVSVVNISNTYHANKIKDTERDAFFNAITSGQDLWDKRESLYPHLVFCENIRDQLHENKAHIRQVMKKLKVLNEYFASYNGVYRHEDLGMGASNESETVRNNPSLSIMRQFKKPDGNEEYFYFHIGFTGSYSGGRIHFLPCDLKRKCYIGYIGRHLPTAKY